MGVLNNVLYIFCEYEDWGDSETFSAMGNLTAEESSSLHGIFVCSLNCTSIFKNLNESP